MLFEARDVLSNSEPRVVLSDEVRAALAEGLRRPPQQRKVTAAPGPTRCAKCREVKPPEDFYSGGRANGLSSYCRDCSKKAARASAVKYQTAVREASARVDVQPNSHGLCRAFLNLGAWSGRSQCSRSAAPGTGGYCMTHVPAERRDTARTLRSVLIDQRPFGSEDFRKRRELETKAILEAATSDPEIAQLIDEQTKDARRLQVQGGWVKSIDAPDQYGRSGHETLGYEFLRGYVTDAWTHAVHAVVDERREIDAWGDEWEQAA